MSCQGSASGPGALFKGGSTGPGLKLSGGTASGDGLLVTTISGHGFNVTAAGASMDAFHLVGAAGASSSAAGHGINAIGGASTTSPGGTSGVGVRCLGGAGAAITNGAGDGFSAVGGGTTTVSGGSGMTLLHTGSGSDFNVTTTPIIAAVWDLATSGHTTAGTFGAALVAAGTAADPWSTVLPGAYGAGTAGFIVGHNVVARPTVNLDASSFTFATASAIFAQNLGTFFYNDSDVTGAVVDNVDTPISGIPGGVWSVPIRTLSTGGNAAVATSVWTDTTAGDFTTASSPGKILKTQLGGAFTTTSSSIFSIAALANAPSGGGGGGSNLDAITIDDDGNGTTVNARQAIAEAYAMACGDRAYTQVSPGVWTFTVAMPLSGAIVFTATENLGTRARTAVSVTPPA